MDATLTFPASAFSRWSFASSYNQLSTAIARPPQDITDSKSSTDDASRSFDATESTEDAACANDIIQTAPSDVAMDSSQSHDPSPCLRPVAYRNEAYLNGEGNLLTRCCRVATRPPGQPCTLNPKSLRRHETFIVAEPEL
ncbi:hypothetical protein EV121DRAFT_291034 [Schizophyllum commune]